jgi:hypothetical protein
MERILYQAEGGTAEGLQGVLERHGTKASVRCREREIEQTESSWIGRGLPCQPIPAAAQQVTYRIPDGFHPRRKLHGDHLREQVRLRLGWCGDQACVTTHLDIRGQRSARAK